MSEPITKACDGCHGTGWSRGFICGPCDGSGRVPDVEATLRAEVARLTEEVERLKAEKNHARQAQVLIQRARNEESDRSSAAWIAQVKIRDAEVARLTAEVERLTERDKAAEAMFRDGEWNGRGQYWFGPCCPNCGGTTDTGHGADCPRAAWLAGCKS